MTRPISQITRTVIALAVLHQVAAAQAPVAHARGVEFMVTSGYLAPTGAQRDAIKGGQVTAAQFGYALRPSFALAATVGWARSRDVASSDAPKLDVFTYDVGAELRGTRCNLSSTVTLMPFVGAGAGVRSYNYRSLDVDASHNLAGYGSLGGAIEYKRVQLRVEARDYVSGFKPLNGDGASATRNDVMMMVGLRIRGR